MNMNNDRLWDVNADGEIIYHRLNHATKKLYTPDSPFFRSFVPYLMLLVCGATDFFVFLSLFNLICYDDITKKVFSILGLLIGFDVIPIFIGIHARRLRQGLSHDRFILIISLLVTLLTVSLNFGLRVATIDETSPDTEITSQSYIGTTTLQENDQDKDLNSTTVAMALFCASLPVVTSAASFCVSYYTYDPLMIRKRREEELIHQKQDEVRRLEAVLFDYESDADFARRLNEIDEGKYKEMLKLQRAKVISYCDYVRQRIKEELANPSSNTVLSNEDYEVILKRLDDELAVLDKINVSEPSPEFSEFPMTLSSVNKPAA